MHRKLIGKQAHSSYQYITTEMRKKVIDLVVNSNLSLKQAADYVGIHPQTAKNFFIIYKREGRIGKKQKRQKKQINTPFHSFSINLDKEHLMKSKLKSPDWIIQSYISEFNEPIAPRKESIEEIFDSNEYSRVPAMRDVNQPVTFQESTQKLQMQSINIKKETIDFGEEKIYNQDIPLQKAQQYLQFQNSNYAQQLIKNLALNSLLGIKQQNGYNSYSQFQYPKIALPCHFPQL